MPQFGFHTAGRLFAVEYTAGWVGLIEHGSVSWTAGPRDPGLAAAHLDAPLEEPRFVAMAAHETALVCDAHRISRIELDSRRVTPLVEAADLAVTELGNCVPAPDGRLWVNDILGHQVLVLSPEGRLLRRLGDGTAGFQRGTVGFDDARFGQIYDLRCGPDGLIHILDSTNYAVRVADPRRQTVATICGDGRPGASGDGGPAVCARLGGDPAADFDGPWALVVDPCGDVYIADTHNHAIRRIDAASGEIATIAAEDSPSPPVEGVLLGPPASGDGEASWEDGPLFAKVCGLDFDPATGRLLVPDWVDDTVDELLVLSRAIS